MTSTAHKLIKRRVDAYHNVRNVIRIMDRTKHLRFDLARHREVQRLMLIARERLRRKSRHTPKIGVSKKIIEIAAGISGIAVDYMLCHRRAPVCSEARWVAAWLIRKHTKLSTPEIGRRLGGRDHSTILYGLGKVDEDLASGGDRFGAAIAAIEARL